MIAEDKFNNLQINDIIYFYDDINNVIKGVKITGITYKTIGYSIDKKYKIIEMIEMIGDFNIKHKVNKDSLIFLSEIECLNYSISNWKEELREKYGEKYPEYFI